MLRYLTSLLQKNSLLQTLFVCLLWLSCELTVKLTKLPLPGGILGLGLVLLLLLSKKLALESIKGGAQLLLKEMLLFFIPAVLAVLEHREFLGLLGIKILAVIILSTVSVILVTALVVDLCYYWRTAHATPTAQ
ncbi:CidA/LrgA family protein [Legionella sp. km772]|uniref:CidA/LrgA family protein n=1 Tax=Legionella sp. km772 TaxID=2498111 RepID=UPI000F8D8FB0|nr:CidA/LrgA family protein [Legionella sp. km772]RUR09725.1 CidA/LrgA family protein [Legionella sp. km772]